MAWLLNSPQLTSKLASLFSMQETRIRIAEDALGKFNAFLILFHKNIYTTFQMLARRNSSRHQLPTLLRRSTVTDVSPIFGIW